MLGHLSRPPGPPPRASYSPTQVGEWGALFAAPRAVRLFPRLGCLYLRPARPCFGDLTFRPLQSIQGPSSPLSVPFPLGASRGESQALGSPVSFTSLPPRRRCRCLRPARRCFRISPQAASDHSAAFVPLSSPIPGGGVSAGVLRDPEIGIPNIPSLCFPPLRSFLPLRAVLFRPSQAPSVFSLVPFRGAVFRFVAVLVGSVGPFFSQQSVSVGQLLHVGSLFLEAVSEPRKTRPTTAPSWLLLL
ncbi:hypothetical protein NDU88_001756 [Pleurodeles waltl]|uniref:Uncharacterized protein n=1 Tax=Pleurodeles waltl TaxID=8319 RepID=A0AAV7NEB8_PLEWA|nr:hypothetical protein NDU88_001756 [Pleurodeles waltl]